jgi:hypothetical protein
LSYIPSKADRRSPANFAGAVVDPTQDEIRMRRKKRCRRFQTRNTQEIAMADFDHKADLKRYVPTADDKHIAAIIKHLGIAMKSKDSSMVACSSSDELSRIRDSWCKKKLGLTNADADLDKGIKEICDKMKGDKNKSRVAFYYLLAEKYGKLGSL